MSRSRSRTVFFPRRSLQTCEDWISILPPAKTLDKSSLLQELGYTNPTSGPAGSALGALSMYGFISKTDNVYEMTNFGRSLRSPVSGEQATILRIIAFLLPERFRELYQESRNSTIPASGHISNLVQQRYTVTDKVARTFESVFIESGVRAELLNVDENQLAILDAEDILTFLDIDLENFAEPSDDILGRTTDRDACQQVLESIKQSTGIVPSESIQKSGERDSTKVKTPRNLSKSLEGDEDLIQFEIDDVTYIVEKAELEKFIRTEGKMVSERKFKV